ncbi:conserved hypothetical protein [Ricinus communis]|uniref:Uncharacterized protein n=1 Tax=Ricinus communis TaxID=3988 RepID=B9T2P7_RICCO|nr:conserved hypothetical protein [Ricinus communis]
MATLGEPASHVHLKTLTVASHHGGHFEEWGYHDKDVDTRILVESLRHVGNIMYYHRLTRSDFQSGLKPLENNAFVFDMKSIVVIEKIEKECVVKTTSDVVSISRSEHVSDEDDDDDEHETSEEEKSDDDTIHKHITRSSDYRLDSDEYFTASEIEGENDGSKKKKIKLKRFNAERNMDNPRFEVGPFFKDKEEFKEACKQFGIEHKCQLFFPKNEKTSEG